jgi:hypothetical protein
MIYKQILTVPIEFQERTSTSLGVKLGVTLEKENGLMVFENKVRWITLEPKDQKATE